MDTRFSQIAQEIGTMVADGVHDVLIRVQNDVRVKSDPQASALGVMDGMTHMLATCAIWVINSRRGRSRELNPEETDEMHDRLKSKLIEATRAFMEGEMQRLRRAEDSSETEEGTGHA